MSIRERHRGQPSPCIAATVSAHVEQKRECLQGSKATPERGTRRQTSQQSATSGDDSVGRCSGWRQGVWLERLQRQWEKAVEEPHRRHCQHCRLAQFHTFKMLQFGLPIAGLPFSAPPY